jgi:acyl-CoA thioesterase I
VFAQNGAHYALPQPSAAPLRVLAIGSSSTQGVGASAPAFSYPARLAADLATLWGIKAEVRNAGVGGEKASTTLLRLKAALGVGGTDLVLWQVGTNDAVDGADDARFRTTLVDGVAAAQAAHVPIILIDPQYFPSIKNTARYESYVAMIGDAGATRHAPVFSRYAMMKAWEQKSAVELNGMLSPDGFHMSDHGYACLARALAGSIEQGAPPIVMGAHPGAQEDRAKRL